MAPENPTWTGSRRLLRQMRQVMAGPDTAQERLDQIVRLIAAEMVAEVCSVYLRRAGEVLELFATEGLRRDAVHRTHLLVGEGLVGDIAARATSVAIADAQSHPLFAHRPDTGEEAYASLMGVPMLRGGRVLGVLVVQNRVRRHYSEDEVETLETIAMVLAELVAGGELVGPDEAGSDAEVVEMPGRLEGLTLNSGLAAGRAVLHRRRAAVAQVVAEDPRAELERLPGAVSAMLGALDDMLERPELARGEHRDVLETYRMIARDQGWLKRIEEGVRSGLTAEAAVQKVQNDIRARMAQVKDAYLRERLMDLEDLADRLISHLTGTDAAIETALPGDMVLVARNLGPAELLNYDRERLRGIVLEEGAATSHVAIVARAFDIPVIGSAAGALALVEPGDLVLVDADNGQVFVRPTDDVRTAFAASMSARKRRLAKFAALRDEPAVTKDGVEISLMINAGLLIDMQHLHDSGADGVGLYRTELPFMTRSEFPSVSAQADLYRRVLDQAEGKQVVFRTLDIGGDKLLPYFAPGEEENPAMGWRAVRIALDRPLMLRHQVRALLKAAGTREIWLMFPMVAEAAEFLRARDILNMELARASSGPVPGAVRVGVMLEVPALAWQLDALLPLVDFVSVGSNDLLQFLFASDRGNPRLEGRYDSLAPAALTMLGHIARSCDAAGVPLALCGEMAGRPLEAMALIGLGFRALSMAPASIGPVKAMVRSLSVAPLREYLRSLANSASHSARPRLRAFAQDHVIIH